MTAEKLPGVLMAFLRESPGTPAYPAELVVVLEKEDPRTLVYPLTPQILRNFTRCAIEWGWKL